MATQPQLPVSKTRNSSTDLHEFYADYFAFELLAPREEVRKISPAFSDRDAFEIACRFNLLIPHAQAWLKTLRYTESLIAENQN